MCQCKTVVSEGTFATRVVGGTKVHTICQSVENFTSIGARHRGPKKRRLNNVCENAPLKQGTVDLLATSGPNGGSECVATSLDAFELDYEDQQICYPEQEHWDRAREDLKVTTTFLRQGGCRRAVDDLDIPCEVWRMLFFNTLRGKHPRYGIGSTPSPLFQCSEVWKRLLYILAFSMAAKRIPWQINVSRCWTLNNK